MLANDQRAGDGKAFIIVRKFQAPRDLVWKAWSEPERLKEWWGPKGCRLRVERLEFRPGGFFHYAMEFSNGPGMWGRFMYRDIVAPESLSWLNSFSNERCGITRAPFSEYCPLEISNTVTMTEGAGATTVTLRAIPQGETPEERKYFEELTPSLEQGYGGTFEMLTQYLAGLG